MQGLEELPESIRRKIQEYEKLKQPASSNFEDNRQDFMNAHMGGLMGLQDAYMNRVPRFASIGDVMPYATRMSSGGQPPPMSPSPGVSGLGGTGGDTAPFFEKGEPPDPRDFFPKIDSKKEEKVDTGKEGEGQGTTLVDSETSENSVEGGDSDWWKYALGIGAAGLGGAALYKGLPKLGRNTTGLANPRLRINLNEGIDPKFMPKTPSQQGRNTTGLANPRLGINLNEGIDPKFMPDTLSQQGVLGSEGAMPGPRILGDMQPQRAGVAEDFPPPKPGVAEQSKGNVRLTEILTNIDDSRNNRPLTYPEAGVDLERVKGLDVPESQPLSKLLSTIDDMNNSGTSKPIPPKPGVAEQSKGNVRLTEILTNIDDSRNNRPLTYPEAGVDLGRVKGLGIPDSQPSSKPLSAIDDMNNSRAAGSDIPEPTGLQRLQNRDSKSVDKVPTKGKGKDISDKITSIVDGYKTQTNELDSITQLIPGVPNERLGDLVSDLNEFIKSNPDLKLPSKKVDLGGITVSKKGFEVSGKNTKDWLGKNN